MNTLNNVKTARQRLGGISQATFYNQANSGELRVVKIGRRTFVSDDEIERFISKHEGRAVDPPNNPRGRRSAA